MDDKLRYKNGCRDASTCMHKCSCGASASACCIIGEMIRAWTVCYIPPAKCMCVYRTYLVVYKMILGVPAVVAQRGCSHPVCRSRHVLG